MEEKKNDGFDIPTFVENKGEIDKSIFQLDEEEPLINNQKYVPAHSENTAALRQRVASELNEVLNEKTETTPQVVRKEREESTDIDDTEKTPLWIIILAIIAILTALIAAGLFIKDLFFSSPKPAPTPSVTPSASVSPAPTATTTPSVSPSATTTPSPTVSPSATVTPTPTTTTTPAPADHARYTLDASMNVRTGPSTTAALIEADDMPSTYKSYANGSVIREGTVITALEVREDGKSKWARIAEKAWICLEDANQVYAKKN